MEEIVKEPNLRGSMLKPFSMSEIVIISSLIFVATISIFSFFGNYVFSFNNYYQFSPFSYSNGSNRYILAGSYTQTFYGFAVGLFVSINMYFIISFMYQSKMKKNNQSIFSVNQWLLKILIVNIIYVALINFYWSNSGSQDINFNTGLTNAISDTSINFINAMSFYFFFSLMLVTIAYYLIANLKKNKEILTTDKSFYYLFKENFLLFYCVNLLIMFYQFFLVLSSGAIVLDGVLLFELSVNLSIIFLKMLFDYHDVKLSITGSFKSLVINFFLFCFASYQYLGLYHFRNNFGTLYSNNFYIYFMFYLLIGLMIFIYVFKTNNNKYTVKSRKIVKNFNPISFFFYQYTLRKLNNNDQAIFFTKKFIIIQSKHLKNSLPGALPSTIPNVVEDIFANDIERLQQLFKINNIKTYSNKAILKFVMNTANLIIKDLQKALQEHLTEELLKEDNDAKKLKINVDELWKKANKIMLQWESTFTDTEMNYKDSLLIK